MDRIRPCGGVIRATVLRVPSRTIEEMTKGMIKTNQILGGRLAGPMLAVTLVMTVFSASAYAADTNASKDEITNIRITVTHFPTLLYAVPYIVAMEKGFFAEEGIKVTEIAGSEGGGTT